MENEHRKNYSVDTVVSPVPWVKKEWVTAQPA